jgi:D-3-phosphoglycerate dehydrogenase
MDDSTLSIFVAEKSSFSARGLQAIVGIGATTCADVRQSELAHSAKGFHILIVRLGLQVNAQVIQSNSQLRIIGSPTTGLDHIDLEAARACGVAVISLKGERAFLDQVYATAEHTFALLLSLLRHIPTSFASVKDYQWRRDIYRGNELNGKTLGIVGCGRLGSLVAGYAQAFGMQVLTYDPYQPDFPSGVQPVQSLNEMLSQSEIVSIHAPLNPETTGMFSYEQFSALTPGAWLVNTSRGAIIDQAALLDALETGKLSGAALDVICDEMSPLPKPNPLIEYARLHDNLIITPHLGGATQESIEKADLFLVQKIIRYLDTNPQ